MGFQGRFWGGEPKRVASFLPAYRTSANALYGQSRKNILQAVAYLQRRQKLHRAALGLRVRSRVSTAWRRPRPRNVHCFARQVRGMKRSTWCASVAPKSKDVSNLCVCFRLCGPTLRLSRMCPAQSSAIVLPRTLRYLRALMAPPTIQGLLMLDPSSPSRMRMNSRMLNSSGVDASLSFSRSDFVGDPGPFYPDGTDGGRAQQPWL